MFTGYALTHRILQKQIEKLKKFKANVTVAI